MRLDDARRSFVIPVLLGMLVLGGCGIQPSGVERGPQPPTGLAPGPTLYFLDEEGSLIAQQRETGRLGSVSEAVALLLTGPGLSDLRTGIDTVEINRVLVSQQPGLLRLRLPLARYEVTDSGAAQIVCTAIAAHVQAGGSSDVQVQLEYTISDAPASPTTCPVL
jgi:hypothetical protein